MLGYRSVFSALLFLMGILLFLFGAIDYTMHRESNRCKMSYMFYRPFLTVRLIGYLIRFSCLHFVHLPHQNSRVIVFSFIVAGKCNAEPLIIFLTENVDRLQRRSRFSHLFSKVIMFRQFCFCPGQGGPSKLSDLSHQLRIISSTMNPRRTSLQWTSMRYV